MAYDHDKSRELLRVAQSYASHPMGEFLSRLATQLVDAEAEMTATVKVISDLRNEQKESDRRLADETKAHAAVQAKMAEEIRVLNENRAALIAELTVISGDARGAKQRAKDAIDKLNPAPASTTA